MILVNPVYLHEFVAPLIGGADSEFRTDKYSIYNFNLEAHVKKIANEELLPDFVLQDSELQNRAKNTLAYYLANSNKIDFQSIYNSLLLPIDTPENCYLFFWWIWEVFFRDESPAYIKSEIVKEDFDANATINLLKSKKRGSKLD